MNFPPRETLGGFHALASPARQVADGVFVGVLMLTAALERLQYRLRATETSLWWASNGRDVVNTFALASTTAGLHFLGFNGPLSFLLAALLVVTLTALQPSVEGSRHATAVTAGLSLVLGAPMLMAPDRVDAFVRLALLQLFP